MAVAVAIALTAALSGCLSTSRVAPVAPVASAADCVTIWVLSNGFHTSLVLPPEAARAAGLDPADAAWIEIGWGEAAAYQAQSMNPLILLRAAVAPGETALFVARMPFDPARYGPDQARAVTVSYAGLRTILSDIAAETRRAADGRSVVLSVAANGTFVAATSRFGLFRNCNVWLAERLRRAGVPLPARPALTARGLYAALPASTCPRPAPLAPPLGRHAAPPAQTPAPATPPSA